MTTQAITDIIASAYSHLIGQTTIIRRRVKIWTAYAMGANPEGAFLQGAAGLGKTALLRADLNACQLAGEIRKETEKPLFYQSAGELRLAGENWTRFMGEFLTPGGTGICYLDEMHELFSPSATVQTGKIISLIKGLSDSQRGDFRQVSFGDEGTVERHAGNIAFVVATNFPEKMKDAEAILSRLGVYELALYSPDELTAIAVILADAAGIKVAENTISVIAHCGRGTARPVEKIVQALKRESLLAGKSTVNKADVVNVMRDLELYPRGLTLHEVSMLIHGCKGYVSKVTLATVFNVSAKAIADSVAFLHSADMIAVKGSTFTTSQIGRDYIAAIAADKFTMPV